MAFLGKSLQKYAFGQVLSMILAATGLINSWLYEKMNRLNIPALEAALTYSLILCGSIAYLMLKTKKKKNNEKNDTSSGLMPSLILLKEHKKVLLGSVLFDVAANWLVVKAFSELKLPEVMVFAGLSTPAAIVMGYWWTHPRPRYTRLQVLGVFVALSVILLYSVMTIQGKFTRSSYGIFCAVASALAYAASNNFQERAAHVLKPVEFLLGLGFLGGLISWVAVLFSLQEIEDLVIQGTRNSFVIALIFMYAVILSSFYLLIPVYMSSHSAVSFNFSLLTANFLGILGSWFLLRAEYSKWLYGTIFFINLGLLLYYFGEETASLGKTEMEPMPEPMSSKEAREVCKV